MGKVNIHKIGKVSNTVVLGTFFPSSLISKTPLNSRFVNKLLPENFKKPLKLLCNKRGNILLSVNYQ